MKKLLLIALIVLCFFVINSHAVVIEHKDLFTPLSLADKSYPLNDLEYGQLELDIDSSNKDDRSFILHIGNNNFKIVFSKIEGHLVKITQYKINLNNNGNSIEKEICHSSIDFPLLDKDLSLLNSDQDQGCNAENAVITKLRGSWAMIPTSFFHFGIDLEITKIWLSEKYKMQDQKNLSQGGVTESFKQDLPVHGEFRVLKLDNTKYVNQINYKGENYFVYRGPKIRFDDDGLTPTRSLILIKQTQVIAVIFMDEHENFLVFKPKTNFSFKNTTIVFAKNTIKTQQDLITSLLSSDHWKRYPTKITNFVGSVEDPLVSGQAIPGTNPAEILDKWLAFNPITHIWGRIITYEFQTQDTTNLIRGYYYLVHFGGPEAYIFSFLVKGEPTTPTTTPEIEKVEVTKENSNITESPIEIPANATPNISAGVSSAKLPKITNSTPKIILNQNQLLQATLSYKENFYQWTFELWSPLSNSLDSTSSEKVLQLASGKSKNSKPIKSPVKVAVDFDSHLHKEKIYDDISSSLQNGPKTFYLRAELCPNQQGCNRSEWSDSKFVPLVICKDKEQCQTPSPSKPQKPEPSQPYTAPDKCSDPESLLVALSCLDHKIVCSVFNSEECKKS